MSTSQRSRVRALVEAGESLAALGWRIVDVHAHLGPTFQFYIPSPEARSMVAAMDRLGIDLTCLASHLAVTTDYVRGNDLSAQAAQAFPGRLQGYVVVNLRDDANIEAELRRGYDVLGLRGIKLHPMLHDFAVLDPRCEPIWRFAEERGAPILSHSWEEDARCRPKAFGQLAAAHPSIPFLLGHSGGTIAGRREAVAVAKEHKNIYLELCSSYLTCAELEWMVREVGAERILFGTDSPWLNPAYTLGRVAYANLSDEQLRLILGENAARLFAL